MIIAIYYRINNIKKFIFVLCLNMYSGELNSDYHASVELTLWMSRILSPHGYFLEIMLIFTFANYIRYGKVSFNLQLTQSYLTNETLCTSGLNVQRY